MRLACCWLLLMRTISRRRRHPRRVVVRIAAAAARAANDVGKMIDYRRVVHTEFQWSDQRVDPSAINASLRRERLRTASLVPVLQLLLLLLPWVASIDNWMMSAGARAPFLCFFPDQRCHGACRPFRQFRVCLMMLL